MAHLAYKFRLNPNATQAKALAQQLETLRRVFNDALQLSKDVYATTGKSAKKGYLNKVVILSRNAQFDDLKEGRGGPKWLTQVAAVAIRDTCARVEVAFDNFFRRLKTGGKAGFPRFKKYGRLRSIPFNNYASGCTLRGSDGKPLLAGFPEARKGCRLDLFGVGRVKVIVHRAVVGTIKTACVERDVDGKWYVVLVAQTADAAAPQKEGPAVGIDVGLEYFLTTSDGKHVENPRLLKGQLKTLRRFQRASSRKIEGAKKRKAKFRECKNLQKSFHKVARLHVRVRNLRKEHHHQVANCLVREYATICAEKLNIRGMVRNGKLSRAISDVAWGGFLILLKHKAQKAGARLVEVDASRTSQTCPECGAVAKKKLSQRTHRCPCGYTVQRDHASARVILARGCPENVAGPVTAVRVNDSASVGMLSEQSGGGRRGQQKSLAETPKSPKPKANRSRKKSQQLEIPWGE